MNKQLTFRMKKVAELLNLNLNKKSPKGWIAAKCPFCNRDDKFAVKFNHDRKLHKNHISFNCFHGSCQQKGTEFHLFKHLDVLHFLGSRDFISTDKVQNLINTESIESVQTQTPIRHKPFGFRKITDNKYLNSRGFESWQYDFYTIGTTKLDYHLKDYVIFLIEEQQKNRGYVARITWSKEKIKQVEASGKLVLRYKNESTVDFSKILFGIDQVDDNTTDAILVEGPLDKTNVDKLIEANKQNNVVCLCTFGKKISINQIVKLRSKGKNIHTVTVLYDPDAIQASKNYSQQLQSWFETIKVGCLQSIDPGEIEDYNQLHTILNNSITPNEFDVSKVQMKKLKT